MSFSVLAAARERPAADALVVDGVAWSYRRLAEEVRAAIARLPADPRLGAAGEAPRVGLLARAEAAAVVQLLALVELGLPVVLLHPRASAAERAEQLRRAGATTLLGEPDEGAAPPGEGQPALAEPEPLPDDQRWLAVLFTSGSTGAPRAVALSRAAFAAAAAASRAHLALSPGDRWLLALPFAHVGGLSVLLRCLQARATVVLSTGSGGRSAASSPAVLAEVVARDRVTLLSLVPTQLHRLLAHQPPLPLPSSLRAILLGGAAAAPALLSRAEERGLPVLCTYGLTETCAQVATVRPGTRGLAAAGCGPPLPGVELRITGAGAIAVRTPALLSGYLTEGGLSSPLDPDGFLITGDAGRIDAAGRLHVLGRLDQVIISGGEKVHPQEVEAALSQAPAVAEACACGLPDAEWGQVVAAALVAAAGAPPEPERRAQVDQALQALSPLKRPRRLAWLDALPLLPSGKVDRQAVARAIAAAPPG